MFELYYLFSKSRIYRDCSKLALGKAKETRQAIEDSISEALLHSPSIIIFDDLDSLISVSSDPQVSHSSSSSDSLVRYFADIMDEYKVRICHENFFIHIVEVYKKYVLIVVVSFFFCYIFPASSYLLTFA